MQYLFRLSQKSKPVATDSEYGLRLGSALETLMDGSALRAKYMLSLRGPNQQITEERVRGALSILEETWNLLNSRRLELEELRSDDRLSRVHEEAVKSLRAALEVWNREAQHFILLLQGQPQEAARQQRDINQWKDIFQRLEKKLLLAFQSAQLEHPDLWERLHLPDDVLCSYQDKPPPQAADLSSSQDGSHSNDADGDTWPAVKLADLAAYLRFHATGEAKANSFPTEAAINLRLESLMMQPERWDELPAERLALLFASSALRLAFYGDIAQVAPLARLYQTVARRLPVTRRRQLLDDVSPLLDSDVIHLQALVPIIFNDPDQYVVSTAALNLATISPLSGDDSLTGPKRCLQMAAEHGDGTDMTTLGVVLACLPLETGGSCRSSTVSGAI